MFGHISAAIFLLPTRSVSQTKYHSRALLLQISGSDDRILCGLSVSLFLPLCYLPTPMTFYRDCLDVINVSDDQTGEYCYVLHANILINSGIKVSLKLHQKGVALSTK